MNKQSGPSPGSDEKLNALIASFDDIVFELDATFRFLNVWVNNSDLLFMPKESFLGKNIREVFDKDYADQFISLLQTALATGDIITHEYRSPLPNDERLYRARITPWDNEGGVYKKVFVVIADITAVVRSAHKINTDDERYRVSAKDADAGIWDWNIVDGSEWWSPKYYELLGYEYEEIPPGFNTFLNELLHPADREKVRSSFKDHINHNISSRLEVRMRTKSGKYKWFETGGRRQWYENNKPVRMIGLIIDITEKKESEIKLRESRERFEQTVKYAPIGVALLSTEGKCLHVNRSLCKIMGYTEEELINRDWHTVTYPDDIRKNDELIARLIAGKIDNFELEKRYIHKQGHIIWALLCSSIIRDMDGKPLYTISQILDITNRKEQETEREKTILMLNRKNEQLSNFAYIVSHNLRSHSSNLKALTALHDDASSAEEKKLYFEKIKSVSNALNITIDELAQIITVTNDGSHKREPLFFERIFERVKNAIEADIIKNKVYIRTDFSSCPSIEYSAVYLESILQNLLTNAIKYRSEERRPEIYLKTEISNNNKVLSFTDNGKGIDLEKYGEKIFGLYKTFHHHPEARGIGLFLVKTQVESMGGTIKVFSQPGMGTTFEITF